MVDVKHQKCYILVLIVVISTLVPEFSLDLDDTVKSLVGDKCLVPSVQLQQCSWVRPVNHSIVLSCPRARVSQVKKLTSIELQALCS